MAATPRRAACRRAAEYERVSIGVSFRQFLRYLSASLASSAFVISLSPRGRYLGIREDHQDATERALIHHGAAAAPRHRPGVGDRDVAVGRTVPDVGGNRHA